MTGLPYQRHSTTSKAAADAAVPMAERAIDRVRSYIAARGIEGATDEEIQTALRMNANTQRPRRVELEDRGLIADSGRVRDTSSGRHAVVWIAAAFVDPG